MDNIEIRNDGDETGFIIQIEAVTLETDAENGDYLTVTGRFLMSLLSRRIIYPTLLFSALTSYADMVRLAVYRNCMQSDNRLIPGLRHGNTSGTCWEQKSRLQVSYENLMEWIFKVCEMIGGTANIRLQETSAGSGVYTMMLDLAQGTDRSILQEDNAHIVFSDSYCNLLTFGYSMDLSAQKNVAYVLGCDEGAERKRTVCYRGSEPAQLNRYEVYMDAKDVSDETQVDGETVPIADEDYVGCSVQTDSINVKGNAVLDYSDKSPNPRALIDNNDLYDTDVNLINSGLCVMVDYPLEESLDRVCDSYAKKNCGLSEGDDGYEDAYNTSYLERMNFLKGKHVSDGYVTWSFYTDKENTVVIPSLWIDPEDTDSHEVLMELDFATLIPSTIGDGMKEWTLEKLQNEMQTYDAEYSPTASDAVEDLAARLKALKWTKSEDRQQNPSNIFNYLGTDTLNYDFEVPMTTLITDEDVSDVGYYGLNQLSTAKKAVVITTKGWHTISLKSNNGSKFMAFGLNFLPYREYKRIVGD